MTIEVSGPAHETLARIHDHLGNLSRVFGEDSPEYLETAASFAMAMGNVFRLLRQGGKLVAEYEMSLGLACESGLYVGVIFFRDEKQRVSGTSVNEYRACMRHREPWPDNGQDRCPYEHQTDEDWCLPTTFPMRGTWSLHS